MHLPPTDFITTKEASKRTGYSLDYIARLARSGEVAGQIVGRAWYVDPSSLATFLQAQEERNNARARDLAETRAREYKSHKNKSDQKTPSNIVISPIQYPVTAIEQRREVLPVYVSRASLRSPSFFSEVGAVLVASLLVLTGALVGQSHLIPNVAERALAIGQHASSGFAVISAPVVEDVASHAGRMRALAFGVQGQARPQVGIRYTPPEIVVPSSLPLQATTPSAVEGIAAASGPGIRREAVGTPSRGSHTTPLGGIALLTGKFVDFTHSLIAADVQIAYAVPRVAPALARSSVLAIGGIGAFAQGSVAAAGTALHRAPLAIAGTMRGEKDGLAASYIAIRDIAGQQTGQVFEVTNEISKLAGRLSQAAEPVVLALSAELMNRGPGIIAFATRLGQHAIDLATEVSIQIKNTAKLLVISPDTTTPTAIPEEAVKPQARTSPTPALALAAAVIVSTSATSTSASTTPSTVVYATSTPDSSVTDIPLIVSEPILAESLSYGDIIDYDGARGTYVPSNKRGDPAVFGVAVENPPILLVKNAGDIPILRSGAGLVNVVLENGPINPGDRIQASSIPGKGMRADLDATSTIGIAREAFSGQEGAVGTIVVDVQGGTGSIGAGPGPAGCTSNPVLCAIAAKVDATPLVALMRYLVAASIAIGSLYLAFRTFMVDAVNGVISVGRNPRAKNSIQAMVVFNGILAVGIALAGLAAALTILLIRI